MKIEVTGLKEISKRMHTFPRQYGREITKTLKASLLKIWEIAGQTYYPSKPSGSKYKRTGTLGRSLGVSEHGGKTGNQPSIYTVETGSNYASATFGTNLDYAPYVIGERQAKQNKHWLSLNPGVAKIAKPEVEKLFKVMVRELARWLDGKGA